MSLILPGQTRSVKPRSTYLNDAYAILNPLAGSIDGLRQIVLEGQWGSAEITAASLASSFAYFLIAYASFKYVERGFTDRV